MARPPSKNPRDRAINVRFTADEHRKVSEAADRAGVSLSAWIREVAIRAARRR